MAGSLAWLGVAFFWQGRWKPAFVLYACAIALGIGGYLVLAFLT